MIEYWHKILFIDDQFKQNCQRAAKLAVNILIGVSKNKCVNFDAQEYKDYGYQVQCNVIEVQFVDGGVL